MSDSDISITAPRSSWTFDGISNRFEAHIERSVPHYREGHDLICRYADFFLRNGSLVHEIGASTGALARRFLEWNKERDALSYIGIDPVESMVEYARQAHTEEPRATYLIEDIVTYEPSQSTVFISYYTLQFIHPAYRQEVVSKLYKALEWGGGFFLFEKVRAPDARFQDYSTQVYNKLKIDNGFTPEDIWNKSESLKGVLEPFSTQGNIDLMERAGFSDILSIYKWVCFEGWLAIK
jgi:tRNA (cmo5U34)-methyltransferase